MSLFSLGLLFLCLYFPNRFTRLFVSIPLFFLSVCLYFSLSPFSLLQFPSVSTLCSIILLLNSLCFYYLSILYDIFFSVTRSLFASVLFTMSLSSLLFVLFSISFLSVSLLSSLYFIYPLCLFYYLSLSLSPLCSFPLQFQSLCFSPSPSLSASLFLLP